MKLDSMDKIIRGAGLDPEEFRMLPEERRIALIRAAGEIPEGYSPVPVGPARGPSIGFTPMTGYLNGKGQFDAMPSGYKGRNALRIADAFAVMAAQAVRGKRPQPFTETQIGMGRHYQALVERHASAGVKCSSIEGRRGGSGRGGDFMDAVLRDREEIAQLRKRVGDGVAMAVRRIRPSKRADGAERRPITDRQLVDLVCVEELTIAQALETCGWSVHRGSTDAARSALAAALDRMAGATHCNDIVTIHL